MAPDRFKYKINEVIIFSLVLSFSFTIPCLYEKG